MTKEINQEQGYKTAQKALDELRKWRQVSCLSFFKIGQILKLFRDKKLYEYLGEGSPEYETFADFLKIPEIDIEQRKAYYFIELYEKFIEQLKFKPEELAEISWTRLIMLLPVLREENSRDLVADARILSRGDLNTKVRQLRSGWEGKECGHKEISQIIYFVCENCKESFKQQPSKSKIIGNK